MDRGLHGLNLPLAPKEGTPGFLITLLRCGTEGEKGRLRLKSHQQSSIKKWSQTLYYTQKTEQRLFLLKRLKVLLLAFSKGRTFMGNWWNGGKGRFCLSVPNLSYQPEF